MAGCIAACVQTNSGREVGPNIEAVLPLIGEACGRGAELILLPENVAMIEPIQAKQREKEEAELARREAERAERKEREIKAKAEADAIAEAKRLADETAFRARHAAEVASLKAAGRWSDGPAGSLFPED